MKIGTTDILKSYTGSDDVKKIYLGTELIDSGSTPVDNNYYYQFNNGTKQLISTPHWFEIYPTTETVKFYKGNTLLSIVLTYEKWQECDPENVKIDESEYEDNQLSPTTIDWCSANNHFDGYMSCTISNDVVSCSTNLIVDCYSDACEGGGGCEDWDCACQGLCDDGEGNCVECEPNPEQECFEQGGCWDGENCNECEPEE